MQQQGYKSIEAIHFNETSQIDSEKYINMRASMFDKMREWFLKEDISIPNNAELVNELSILPDMKLTASGRLQMDAKE
ncbi:MAG: hypothetical protein LBC92_02550, partial [Rickettsiales bacterium]|nr:hypothetical protein [Rickettsiales bacterium]